MKLQRGMIRNLYHLREALSCGWFMVGYHTVAAPTPSTAQYQISDDLVRSALRRGILALRGGQVVSNVPVVPRVGPLDETTSVFDAEYWRYK